MLFSGIKERLRGKNKEPASRGRFAGVLTSPKPICGAILLYGRVEPGGGHGLSGGIKMRSICQRDNTGNGGSVVGMMFFHKYLRYAGGGQEERMPEQRQRY